LLKYEIQVTACKELPNYESTCFRYYKNKKGAVFVFTVPPTITVKPIILVALKFHSYEIRHS